MQGQSIFHIHQFSGRNHRKMSFLSIGLEQIFFFITIP